MKKLPNRCSRCKCKLPSTRHVCNACIEYAVKKVTSERKDREKRMTKRERTRVIKTLDDIEKMKVKMAKLRDDLRDKVDDLEGILESLNTGLDEFDSARRSFQDGLDAFSQYV